MTADFAASETPFWMATEPKDLTPSAGFTAGADAGEEEIGAEVSSIEPDVIADPEQEMSSGRLRTRDKREYLVSLRIGEC